VRILSGGERNRLLLAKMFTRPANMLVMDEPTNDLDVDTLELLEDLLTDYDGTLLLVSHDRSFLDNIVTSTMVFEEGGRVKEYVGGYADAVRQRTGVPTRVPVPAPEEAKAKVAPVPAKQAQAKQKLSYKETRELETLPARIEALEAELQQIEVQVARPEFYQQEKDTIAAAMDRLSHLREELRQAYGRWEQLEAGDS